MKERINCGVIFEAPVFESSTVIGFISLKSESFDSESELTLETSEVFSLLFVVFSVCCSVVLDSFPEFVSVVLVAVSLPSGVSSHPSGTPSLSLSIKSLYPSHTSNSLATPSRSLSTTSSQLSGIESLSTSRLSSNPGH